jgi:hypothetical protein
MLQNLLLNQYLGLLPARYWKQVKQPFFYNADFVGATVAAANVTTNVTVAINSDSDFAWFALTRTVYDVTDLIPVPAPYHTVTILDTGSGRQFMSAPIHIENLAGTAQLPYFFMKPIVLGGGGSLTVSITSLGAVNRNIRLTLHGFKMFPMQE